MLYLGVLDDKSLEYPFGKSEAIRQISDEYLIHQCLLNDAVILEEGFLLASSEARNPDHNAHVLLEGIEARLIKVASRYGHFDPYIRERQHFGHQVPPDIDSCNAYLARLQTACVDHEAFLNYGPKSLDGDTFASFLALLDREDFNAHLEANFIQLPRHFKDKLCDAYLHGNHGGQWTARSAWEKTIKTMFPFEDDLVRALMVVVNRERQILRGAGIAQENAQLEGDIFVETGFIDLGNSLVRQPRTGQAKSRDVKKAPVYPRLNAAVLRKNFSKIFSALGQDSPLRDLKATYVKWSNAYDAHPSDEHLKNVTDAAKLYEEQIYTTAQAASFSEGLVSKSVDYTGGLAVGKLVDSFTVHLEKALDFKNKNIESYPGERRDRMTRRCLFWGVATVASYAGFEAGGLSKTAASSIRHYAEHDTLDDAEIVDDLPGSSHQRLRIDKARADIFFRKK